MYEALRVAALAFQDVFAMEFIDDREDYGEARFNIIGMAEGVVLLFVAYTERGESIRTISARRATSYEQEDYFRQRRGRWIACDPELVNRTLNTPRTPIVASR